MAHLAWSPAPHGFLAAGDKGGNVAIWDVRSSLGMAMSPNADVGGDDGVHLFKPHAQYISGMVCHGFFVFVRTHAHGIVSYVSR